MTLRPCLVCGQPSDKTRCPGHRPKDHRVRSGPGQAAHDPVWRALSTHARRTQPWCDDCGTTDDLTADHLIPKSVCPELVHATENIAVRCRTCNSRRGHTGYTDTDVQRVLTALRATFRRRPCRTLREQIAATEQVLTTTRGDAPKEGHHTPERKAKFELHTPGGYR